MTDTPWTDVTRDDPLPADEDVDEVAQGASDDDRPDQPEDGPPPESEADG